jgi:hypothetical protein
LKPRASRIEKQPLALPGRSRNEYIVSRHFGFDGRGGANFRIVGDEVGLTRERVRQIVQEAGTRNHGENENPGALNQAIVAITSRMPAEASEIEAMLAETGVTARAFRMAETFRIEGIVNSARLLDVRLPFSFRVLGKARFVVPPDYPAFKDLLRKARDIVRRTGMASIANLLSPGADMEVARRERSVVEAVLATDKHFQWLDEPSGWFWFSRISGNLVLRRIRKMLCVARTLQVEDIRAGLTRMGMVEPPDRTILAFCTQAPGIEVEGDRIRSKSRLNPNQLLNPTERDIYRILTEHGGCMTSAELNCQAREVNIKRPTFYQCMRHSPIIFKYRGHYSLVGAARQPANAKAAKGSPRAVQTHAAAWPGSRSNYTGEPRQPRYV